MQGPCISRVGTLNFTPGFLGRAKKLMGGLRGWAVKGSRPRPLQLWSCSRALTDKDATES